MRVTALGTSAAYPGPDNACSGWLVEDDNARILIDCGTGVVSRLQKILPLQEVTAVVISHMHADHFFDLFPLRYAYKYALGLPDPPPSLYLPPGGGDILRAMAVTLDPREPERFFPEVFHVQEYDPSGSMKVNGLSFSFAPGQHYVPSWAIKVHGERTAVFTADTGPSEQVEHLARGADLLVSEATYLSIAEEHGPLRGHMTGREAGVLASRVDAPLTLLTHHWPNRDPRVSLEQAREVHKGEMAVAQPGLSYEV